MMPLQSVARFRFRRSIAHVMCSLYVGTTICLGQRLAKLELKMLAAMFVLGFDFSCVDSKGRQLETLPRPNWNDILTCKPPPGSCYLNYERRHSSNSQNVKC